MILQLPRLDKATQSRKWFKSLEKAGVFIQYWPLNPNEYRQWLQHRLQHRGLQVESHGLQLLAARTEGNLLAAAQEVEKLWLIYGEAMLTAADIENAVTDNSRYDIFALTDAAIRGNGKLTIKILDTLHADGTAPTLILWALNREIQCLTECAYAMQRRESLDAIWPRYQAWGPRRSLLSKAVTRRTATQWTNLLRYNQALDEIIKGQRPGNTWDSLQILCLQLAGINLFRPAKRARSA